MGPATSSLHSIERVHGVILDELRLYVVQNFGYRAWVRALNASGRPANHEYKLDQAYPDDEMAKLVVATSGATGKPIPEVLERFGEAMVPEMFRMYSFLVDPKWSYMDFVMNMEPLLHTALHLHTAGALPTKIHATRIGPESVRVVYESPLRVCSAVCGVIRGAATQYGVEVEVTTEQCVLRGDPACVIRVDGKN